MKYEYNIFTDELDLVGQTDSDITSNDARYLKLDQTTAQQVINGSPLFAKGLRIKAGEKIYFDA